jgi:hypothetical protein
MEYWNIKKSSLLNVAAILICFLFVFGTNAHAANPYIKDILITNDTENVLLYARLVNGFKPEMERAVLAGIPVVFTMGLEVYQERSLLWDKKIYVKEIKRTLKYDNLKKTFSVFYNGQADPVVFPDLESAEKAMSDFNGILAAPISSLVRGENYYVQLKIKMDKVRLPLGMEYVFFFVSFWDFETPWYRQNFSY